MPFFRWFKRQKESRGHGIHSPFAFDLITKVIRSPHSYYAFFDIPAMLLDNGLPPGIISSFNHLSFRLAHYLKPRDILEINPGKGINIHFLQKAVPDIRCSYWEGTTLLPSERLFDAIFLYLHETAPLPVDSLLKLGHEDSFWVIHPIREGKRKQFWRKIVNDERINVTFGTKETGIVFPRSPSLTPGRYLA